jgi:hypothetical protein
MLEHFQAKPGEKMASVASEWRTSMQKRTTAKRACPHDELEDAALLLTMSSAQRGSGAYSMPADHASSHFRECRLSLLAQGAQMQYLADELSWVSSITQEDTKVEDDPLRAQSHPCCRAPAVVAGAASCRAFCSASPSESLHCRTQPCHAASATPHPACALGSSCCISTRAQAWKRRYQR